MLVNEALKSVFEIRIEPSYHYTRDKGYQRTGPLEVACGSSYSGDRKLLESNFESEVNYIEHFGIMGLMGFKMRNGQQAIFLFNTMGDPNRIIRVKQPKQLTKYQHQKEALQRGSPHDMPNEDIQAYVTLKTIGGKRL